MRYTTAVQTDESRTFENCLYCYESLTRPIAKKLIHGKLMKVESHGSSIGFNRCCPLRFAKATIQNRDALPAVCIC